MAVRIALGASRFNLVSRALLDMSLMEVDPGFEPDRRNCGKAGKAFS